VKRWHAMWFKAQGMRTKAKLLEPNRERNLSFASVILAFSLFGFLWPHHANTGNERHHIGFQMQKDSQMQESAGDWDRDADGFYAPTRSPGWNGLNH
jgi:hypothetical protein